MLAFELKLKKLNVHIYQSRTFFKHVERGCNKIKIQYLHLKTIRTSNFVFGCFLTFSFHTSLQNFPHHVLQHFCPQISWQSHASGKENCKRSPCCNKCNFFHQSPGARGCPHTCQIILRTQKKKITGVNYNMWYY